MGEKNNQLNRAWLVLVVCFHDHIYISAPLFASHNWQQFIIRLWLKTIKPVSLKPEFCIKYLAESLGQKVQHIAANPVDWQWYKIRPMCLYIQNPTNQNINPCASCQEMKSHNLYLEVLNWKKYNYYCIYNNTSQEQKYHEK